MFTDGVKELTMNNNNILVTKLCNTIAILTNTTTVFTRYIWFQTKSLVGKRRRVVSICTVRICTVRVMTFEDVEVSNDRFS